MDPVQPRHCISNPLFTHQSENVASLRCYLTLMATNNGTAGVSSVGTINVKVKKEGSIWRISELDVILDAPF
ncbi:hypothetical protein D3C71_1908560 [compost metagenome]